MKPAGKRFARIRIEVALLLALLSACRHCEDASNATEVVDSGHTTTPPPDTTAGAGGDDGDPKRVTFWPLLPTTEDQASGLINNANRTDLALRYRRPPPDAGGLGGLGVGNLGERLDQRLARTLRRGRVRAGHASIDAWLARSAASAIKDGRSFFMLWGTHHDASAQVEMFRHVTGPLAPVKWDHVLVEQLRADGRWRQVAPQIQRGDTEDLGRWMGGGAGSSDALASIAATQERDDYAAWKFGYVNAILDIVVDGRTTKHPIEGCDMPMALQATLNATVRTQYGSSLRELHCALALRDAMGGEGFSDASPQYADGDDEGIHAYFESIFWGFRKKTRPKSVAALWGAQHIGLDGFRRFLPRTAVVLPIRVFGGRPTTAGDSTWGHLAARYDIVDPLILPTINEVDDAGGGGGDGGVAAAAAAAAAALLDDEAIEAVMLLADPQAVAHFERKRLREPDAVLSSVAAGKRNFSVSAGAGAAAEIRVDDRIIAVATGDARTEQLSAGPHVLAAPRGKRTLVASFDMPANGFIELRLQRSEPEVTITVHVP